MEILFQYKNAIVASGIMESRKDNLDEGYKGYYIFNKDSINRYLKEELGKQRKIRCLIDNEIISNPRIARIKDAILFPYEEYPLLENSMLTSLPREYHQ